MWTDRRLTLDVMADIMSTTSTANSRTRSLVSSPERSELMRRVRVRNTAPELAVRRILHALGARFRLHASELPGSPDICNRRKSWCIFVHGCFWHGHCCKRGGRPKTNSQFWIEKVQSNQRRDARVQRELQGQGLRVLTVWQCELSDVASLEAKLRGFLELAEAECSHSAGSV